jgi:uncharacterized membrane protein
VPAVRSEFAARHYNAVVMSKNGGGPDDSWGSGVRGTEPGKKLTVMGFLRARFITGVLVAFPIVITAFFALFLFNLLDRWSYPITTKLFGFAVPGAGAVLAVILIFLLGMTAHNVLGRRVLHIGERLLGRLPVLRPVYKGATEVTRAFSANRTQGFRRVVLVPSFYPDVWAVGFVTADLVIEGESGKEPAAVVFVPHTPLPTSGLLLVYPVSRVRPSDLGVEEAIRMVLSGGLLSPDVRRMFPPHATREDTGS